jgi:hypothetical protein
MFEYVVTEPFGDYARGDVIRDAAEIEKVVKDHASRLVRVPAGAVPQPVPPAAPGK